MGHAKYVRCPKRPFILFSMGIGGYGGESELWHLPEEEINVYHILVRIKHEMDLLKKRTGRDFYLFGTFKPFLSPRNKIIDNYGKIAIDVFFTVNLTDLSQLDGVEEPDSEKLSSITKGWRRMIDIDTQQRTSIPKEIRLWGGRTDRPYYGLSLANFEYFRPNEEFYLRGKHLFHYLQESPVTSWNQFTLGTLYVDSTRRHRVLRDRRILATAKLEYPYVYEIRK